MTRRKTFDLEQNVNIINEADGVVDDLGELNGQPDDNTDEAMDDVMSEEEASEDQEEIT